MTTTELRNESYRISALADKAAARGRVFKGERRRKPAGAGLSQNCGWVVRLGTSPTITTAKP